MFSNRRRLNKLKILILAIAALVAVPGFAKYFGSRDRVEASAAGPSPSHTGAAGEDNCTACHSDFPVNSGPGNVTISGLPANYAPGQQVPITVTVSQPSDAVVFGFQLTAIDKDGRGTGTFAVPSTQPQRTQIVTGLVGGNQRRYVEHTIDGIVGGFTSNQWTFTWTAPARRVGKISFHAAGNAANSDGNITGDRIYTTAKPTLSGTAISNFDSDAKSDFAVWRPSNGTWYSLNSTDLNYQLVQWGASGDRIVPGDYDGDGKTDIAVWRPASGIWFVLKSSGGAFSAHFGANGDVPVPGDYDGDLKNDLAIWRPSTGQWFILRSSNGAADIRTWGIASDLPTQADFDGDGKTDSAVYRPSNGSWYIFRSSDNDYQVAAWGSATDKPVPADYDGDGKWDISVYRPSTGTWFILQSANNKAVVTTWGNSTDIPVPADYDGDGRSDVAVYRNGTWYVLQSSNNDFQAIPWGSASDIAVPTGYLPSY